MAVHLQRDLERLKQDLLTTGGMVEEAISKAIISLVDGRLDAAREVLEGDEQIDQKEVKLEEDALKMLALHQPVAKDLRFIVCALKVNNDLERMGDLAVNVAERALAMHTLPRLGMPVDLRSMAQRVQRMVHGALESLVALDVDQARQVIAQDDEVDQLHRHVFDALQPVMRDDPDCIPAALSYWSASRQLERIADLATNVAEDLIFLVEGEVVRHRPLPR